MKHSFEPIIDRNSKVLILGTMPSEESLRLHQYYANPRNQFWQILAAVYGEPAGSSHEDKLNRWKVIATI